MGKNILKETEGYKIKCKTKISDDGEKLILVLEFNPELINFLKQSLSSDKTTTEDHFDFNPEKSYKRFKVKTAIFRQLYSKYSGVLFNCDILNKGILELEIKDVNYLEGLKDCIKLNLKELVKFYYSLDETETISFKIERETD